MIDPIAGWRDKINNREVAVVRWPDVAECPVNAGDRFQLRSCVIEFEKPSRKLVKGKWEWQARFVRHEQDRVFLLRRGLPALPERSEDDANLGLSEQERARREGSYTSSRFAALDGEPESVGPDWKDSDRARREAARHDERTKRLSQNAQEAEVVKLAARVKQEGLERARKGEDLTYLLEDIYARLAEERKKAA